ncbi:FRG domain-containing protein [Bradyrhizobium yuanmingense]|uniref:FRG domain-containing protein n=1 Tax=Bradyrhizobium yuanmingense TaxID=108015 RepID=UPI0023B9B5C4|nr:FRG domain-containing protein [Bradyrhizobium yuanmingense]MDF0521582.1 FRG domain-containing protein [Bradyrhizobium yuanmingense]
MRTAFHRTGRANLTKFMHQDIPALYRHLTGLTTHRFNLQDPNDYAAFLALVQHHGYPTPLLDWTLSPFIAAYFAFRSPTLRTMPPDARVRIFVFDGYLWNETYERAPALSPGFLHATVLEPLALNNPRVLPQQGFSLVTNVDDLEWYIPSMEKDGRKFLTAIDIPVAERPRVLRELELMGINAGSLFPGLDGACNQMKERFFEL